MGWVYPSVIKKIKRLIEDNFVFLGSNQRKIAGIP
jgi:hypothetical protein